MAEDKQKALLLEAYNRGLLDENKKAAVEEAIARGVLINKDTVANTVHEEIQPTFMEKAFPQGFDITPERKPTPLQDKLSTREVESDKIFDDFLGGKIGPRQMVVDTAGKSVAGPMIDILADVAGAGIEGISVMVPDSIEDPVVQSAKDSFNWIANTDQGEYLGEVIDQGANEWQGFKDRNPETARTVEAVVNLGLVFAPAKSKAKSGPIKKVADKIDDIAIKQATNKKRAFVERLVMPKKTAKVKAEEALRTTQVGVFNKNVTQLSPRELAMADEVMKIGVKKGNSLQANLNIIKEVNRKMAIQLDRQIALSNTALHPRTVYDALDKSAKDLISSNPVVVGNAATTAERVSRKAKEFVSKQPPTTHGLLKARKEFDAWIRAQKGNQVFDPINDNIMSLAVRDTRQTLNDVLERNVRGTQVRDSLHRQSNLFNAMDNLAPKAADEASTAVGRLWQNAANIIPMKAQVNRDLAVLLGISTFGAAATFAPWFAGSLVVGGAGVGAYKGVMSATTKKGLAKLLSITDDAIRASRNREMIKQLRLDRAYVADLLKNTPTGEGEEIDIPPAPAQVPLRDAINPPRSTPQVPPQSSLRGQQGASQGTLEKGRGLFGPFDKVFG